MDNQNDQDASVANEEPVVETTEESTDETTEEVSEPSAAELSARLKRAESKIERMKLNQKVEEKVDKIIERKAGELDENQLDFLDVKGITDADDIEVIQKVIQKTGMTVRQALKDDYVQAKLEKLKAAREVKEATPSSTKRTGNSATNDVAVALAKYETTNQLPDDFALRSAVINAKVDKENTNKPGWH